MTGISVKKMIRENGKYETGSYIIEKIPSAIVIRSKKNGSTIFSHREDNKPVYTYDRPDYGEEGIRTHFYIKRYSVSDDEKYITMDIGDYDSNMVSLCRNAALVKTVQISELDNPNLSQIQLNGEILDSAEWTIYRRQGVIRYFRGHVDLPTGSQISAQITNKGTMLIYKRGEGIPAEDVIAAVSMIMKLAKD